MKNIILTFSALILTVTLNAQAPNKMSYQAVIRGSNKELLTNKPIGIKITILQGLQNPIEVYVESHTPTSNDNGLVTLEIGKGTIESGNFENVDWSSGPYFIKTESDPDGGTNYSIVGITELISVPYALYAEKSGSNTSYIEGPGILINGGTISNSGDINATDDITTSSTADGDVNGTFSSLQINPGVVGSSEITDGSIQSSDLNDMGASEGKVLKWNGTEWIPQDDITGSTSISGTQNYVPKFTTTGTTIGNSNIYDNGTNIGVGTSTPDDKLDILGNSQVSGYLKVGNPSEPVISIGSTPISLYKYSYFTGTEAWSVGNPCGDHSKDQWYVNITGDKSGILYYRSHGDFNRSYAYSPWIWVPENSSNLKVEGTYYCNLQAGYDGVYLQYLINGEDWTKIDSFDYGGYVDNEANGWNDACNNIDPQICWNGIYDRKFFRVKSNSFSNDIYGKWVRFRIVGMENQTLGNGNVFELYGLSVTAFRGPTGVGGPFAEGNIYAEKNVFAGSNVLVGDVAEYFLVDNDTEPGELIAISTSKNDSYTISNEAYSYNILGVHSSNPTVTLNAPKGTPVSLVGRVLVKVNDEAGEIKVGDYLTSASLPGFAMKANKSCYVLGRALESFAGQSSGKILCLVEKGWHNPTSTSQNFGRGSFVLNMESESLTIYDESVKNNSRIFITPRGNSGNFWISEILKGSFTLNISNALTSDLKFDYLIDNASIEDLNQKNEIENFENENLLKGENIMSGIKSGINKQLPEYSDQLPPSSPPDSQQGWIWSVENGFIKSNNNN